jgi:hypothetical protein
MEGGNCSKSGESGWTGILFCSVDCLRLCFESLPGLCADDLFAGSEKLCFFHSLLSFEFFYFCRSFSLAPFILESSADTVILLQIILEF